MFRLRTRALLCQSSQRPIEPSIGGFVVVIIRQTLKRMSALSQKADICSAIDHIRFSHYWSALGQKPAAERDVTYISSIRVDNKSSMMQRCRLNFASRFRQQHEELFPASVRRCSSPLLTLNVEIAC